METPWTLGAPGHCPPSCYAAGFIYSEHDGPICRTHLFKALKVTNASEINTE